MTAERLVHLPNTEAQIKDGVIKYAEEKPTSTPQPSPRVSNADVLKYCAWIESVLIERYHKGHPLSESEKAWLDLRDSRAEVVTLRARVRELEGEENRPDPLSQALNSGDGSYKP